MTVLITEGRYTRTLSDDEARADAQQWLDRVQELTDRAEAGGPPLSPAERTQAREAYELALDLLQQTGDLRTETFSPRRKMGSNSPLNGTAVLSKDPTMGRNSPRMITPQQSDRQEQLRDLAARVKPVYDMMVKLGDPDAVTIKAIAGHPGYYIVRGGGKGPSQVAGRELAEREAARRRGR